MLSRPSNDPASPLWRLPVNIIALQLKTSNWIRLIRPVTKIQAVEIIKISLRKSSNIDKETNWNIQTLTAEAKINSNYISNLAKTEGIFYLRPFTGVPED